MTLPIAPRPEPFPVDLGTDARGRVVAVFSRCTAFPAPDLTPRQPTGCRIRVVDLATGKERSAGIRRPKGASDTVAAMWRGRVAYARTERRRFGDVQQVRLWDPRTRRTTRLPHGTMPEHCPFTGAPASCEGAARIGTVTSMDLDDDLLAFRWSMAAPAVAGHLGYEVRAVRLRSRRSVLVGAGAVVETGSGNGRVPSIPDLHRGAVWYSDRNDDGSTRVLRYVTAPRRGGAGDVPATLAQVLRDGSTLLGVVIPPAGRDALVPCSAEAPCTVEHLTTPRLERVTRAPRPPVFR